MLNGCVASHIPCGEKTHSRLEAKVELANQTLSVGLHVNSSFVGETFSFCSPSISVGFTILGEMFAYVTRDTTSCS